MLSKTVYKLIWSVLWVIDTEADINIYNFTSFPRSLPISPIYSFSAAWNDHLYLLNGKIGNNNSNLEDTYNTGLYSFDLSKLSAKRTNNGIILQNINQTNWTYTSNQLPAVKSYHSGVFTSWQSYTQINHLIYSLSPETRDPSVEKYMLIYDLSVPGWVDAKAYTMRGNFAVCATNNNTHIFGIGGITSDSESSESSSESREWDDTGYSAIYDIKNDIWSRTSSMIISIHATGCSYSHLTNNVYSFGGALTDRDVKTDIILKYENDNNQWNFAENNLPHAMMNLFCYELLLSENVGIYCMNGVGSIDVYAYIMKFDVETEIISIIDQYMLAINNKYVAVNAFMSSFSLYEQYALMYVMGGEIDDGDRRSRDSADENAYNYVSQIQYKSFIASVKTSNPTRNPTTIPTKNPTRNPSSKPTRNPTTSKPTRNPTNIPLTTQPTLAPSTISTTQTTEGTTTVKPTTNPSKSPITSSPTSKPTTNPMKSSTKQPTLAPSIISTTQTTVIPTTNPTAVPSTDEPTLQPFMISTIETSTTQLMTSNPTIATTFITSEMATINPTSAPSLPFTPVSSIVPTVSVSNETTSTVPGITPQNYFGTAMGKSVLFIIGCSGICVIIGLVVYFKSSDKKIKQSPMYRHRSSTDPYIYLINDTETFSL